MTDVLNPRAIIGDNRAPPLRDILAERYAAAITDVEFIADAANSAPKECKSVDDVGTLAAIVTKARARRSMIDKARVAEKEPFLTAGRDVDAFFKEVIDRLERIASVIEDRVTVYQRAQAAEARRKADEEARKAREEADRQRRIAEDEAARNRPAAAAKHENKAEAAEERAQEAAAAAAAPAADLTRVRAGGAVVSARTEWAFKITDYAVIPLEKLRPYFKREDVEKAIRGYVRLHKNAEPLAGVEIFEDVKANIR